MARAAAGAIVGVLVLLLGGAALAQGDMVKLLVKKADRLYAQRAAGKAREAISAYEKVLAVDGKSVEARWKLARAYYWVGTHERTEKAKLAAFETGIRYCQEAVKLDGRCAPCQFWLGVSFGMYGDTKGSLSSLGLVPHIKQAMSEVLKLDPGYAAAGAHFVLARVYFRLPSVNGGDNGKAIEHLRKACAMAPSSPRNHSLLAQVLLAEGRKDEARKELEAAVAIPESAFYANQVPEAKEEQAEARALLRKHFDQ